MPGSCVRSFCPGDRSQVAGFDWSAWGLESKPHATGLLLLHRSRVHLPGLWPWLAAQKITGRRSWQKVLLSTRVGRNLAEQKKHLFFTGDWWPYRFCDRSGSPAVLADGHSRRSARPPDRRSTRPLAEGRQKVSSSLLRGKRVSANNHIMVALDRSVRYRNQFGISVSRYPGDLGSRIHQFNETCPSNLGQFLKMDARRWHSTLIACL